MKKYIKQVKKGVAAFLAAVLIVGSGVVAPKTVLADEPTAEIAYLSTHMGHSAAITAEGDLWVWENPTVWGRDRPVKIMENVASVAQGGADFWDVQIFALQTDGSLWAWENKVNGLIGNGTTIDRESPVKIMENVVSVSSGTSGTHAIQTDGSLWVWGKLEAPVKGRTQDDINVPVKIMENVAYFTQGSVMGLVIQTDGSLWTWGFNYGGQRGDGTPFDYYPDETDPHYYNPVKIMENVASASPGFALQTDGSLWSWGYNLVGMNIAALPKVMPTSSVPVKIMENVVSFTGTMETYNGTPPFTGTTALQTDGSLWRLGETPERVMENVAYFASESGSTYAIQTDGSLWAWGNNAEGQLGDGTTDARNSPIKIMEDVTYFTASGAGADGFERFVREGVAFAVKSDGSLWSWGSGNNYRLGNRSNSNVHAPERVLLRSQSAEVVSVTVGNATALAIGTDGSIWQWGGIQHAYLGWGGSYSYIDSPLRYMISDGDTLSTQTETQPPTSDTISVTVNGTAVNFSDQQPAIIDGRTLVPVRGVFETLGFEVSWNQEAQQATLSRANDIIIITLGSATFTTNGASHTLDVPAQSINGRTMLPIRAVLESVGYKLDWDGDTQTVIISTN